MWRAKASPKERASFPRFSSLPPELRMQIWWESVPDLDGITLHNYQKGYWDPRNVPKAESEEADAEGARGTDEEPITFSFHHEKLNTVHVDVPLAFVNREARGVALAWAREEGLRLHFNEAKECPVFVHRFEPARDALFVGIDQWRPFCNEPHNRLAEPDLSGLVVNNTTELTRLAVPHTTIWRDVTSLADVLHWYPRLRTMYIVLDIDVDIVRETLLAKGDRNKARARLQRQQWKVKDSPERSLVWDREKRQFVWRGRETWSFGSSELCGQMEEMGGELAQRLAEKEDGEFEIRPVYAVKG
ncbi:hypothetical protein HDV57DRAFT_63980 [Trichoderma longibrachiatum]